MFDDIEGLCVPALIYLIYGTTRVIMDTYKGLFNLAMMQIFITILFTYLLNVLCRGGLGIISWIIVAIPFLLMSVIAVVLLGAFGLDPVTGKAVYTPQAPNQNNQPNMQPNQPNMQPSNTGRNQPTNTSSNTSSTTGMNQPTNTTSNTSSTTGMNQPTNTSSNTSSTTGRNQPTNTSSNTSSNQTTNMATNTVSNQPSNQITIPNRNQFYNSNSIYDYDY